MHREKGRYPLTPLPTHPRVRSGSSSACLGLAVRWGYLGSPRSPEGSCSPSFSKSPRSPPGPQDSCPSPPRARPRPLGLRRAATAARRALLPSADLAWRRRRLLKGGLEAAAADPRPGIRLRALRPGLAGCRAGAPGARRSSRNRAGARTLPRPPTCGGERRQDLSWAGERSKTCRLPPRPSSRRPRDPDPNPGRRPRFVPSLWTAPTAPSVRTRLDFFPHFFSFKYNKRKGGFEDFLKKLLL